MCMFRWVFALAFLFFLLVQASAFGQGQRNVYVIPVSGDVEPAMSAYIKRALAESAADGKALIVLEMSTFGGRVDAALDIVETMLQAEPRKTVAFVTDKAISAGALIALSCNTLVMRPNSTIGDCAPITFANEGPKMLGEKFQSPLRAKFRTLARRNGYPATLAESMVTADMEVFELRQAGTVRYLEAKDYEELSDAEKKAITSKKTVVAKGELLTMDDAEALKLGFSSMTAGSIEEMLAAMGLVDYRLHRVEESWSESMGRLIVKLSPVLLMIGLAALYLEMKAPGFGLPGITGIICLGLVFFNQHLIGLADYTELIFIMLGLVLLALEVFVLPGFGIAGMSGILAICIGMILSFQDFVVPDPNLPWQQDILLANVTLVLGSFVVAFLAALFFLRFVFPRLGRLVEGPYLATDLAASHADSYEAQGIRVGDRGTAHTLLRPSGKVHFGDETIDVVTEGEFIEKGTPVQVSRVRGNTIVVTRDK